MRAIRILVGLLGLLAIVASLGAATDEAFNTVGFRIRRGINLNYWLSQCFAGEDKGQFITERDIEYIRALGYDHVRLPVDEKELWTPDGKRVSVSFARLTTALDWCRKHELRAIVDLHTINSHHFNSENGKITLWSDPRAQARFLELWTDLSEALHGYPLEWVAYELLNEPVADNPGDWNALAARAIALLRQHEPQRVLVVGSNRWQHASTFPDLEVPQGDPNLILSVHDYEPFAFTHHAASWTKIGKYLGPVHYPGPTITKEELAANVRDPELLARLSGTTGAWNRAKIAEVLQPAIAKSRALHLQLYCGEFGCMPTVPRQDRLAWYADTVTVLEENGIAWSNWGYKRTFGIIPLSPARPNGPGAPDLDLIKAMLLR